MLSLLEERNLEGMLLRWLVHEQLSPPATLAEVRLGAHRGRIHLEYLMNLAAVDLRTPWRPAMSSRAYVWGHYGDYKICCYYTKEKTMSTSP